MAKKPATTGPIGKQLPIKEKGPLKDMLNAERLYEDALIIKKIYRPFQADNFAKSTMDETWNNLELKARIRQITLNLGKYLPNDYKESISIIDKIVANFSTDISIIGFSFPDFVEVYGSDKDNLDISIAALEKYTTYWSSELAIRLFIIKYEEHMLKQMYEWTKHENEHVRRLASEGCRPQLPWAQALTSFKKDPLPILPILEQLKTDPSQYVRKSVANNLNDISKTHPDLVIKIAKEWYGKNEYTNWILKHGCRTLLKNANHDVLAIFGYHNVEITVNNFSLDKKSISIGEEITFSFSILTKVPAKVRLEYGIDYMKFNGKRNRKIFQISEITLGENVKKNYLKKHSFADVSTRKHYPGTHSITLIVNGVERETFDFALT